MARGVNKVILVGNLGADPETRYMPSGSAVTNIRIATSESWKDKESGEQKERTEWHRIAFYNRLAEVAGEYLKKGAQVYIEGRLRTRTYEKEGQTHYSTEILGSRAGAGNPDRADVESSRESEPKASAPNPKSADFSDDDIPF